MIALVDYGLGNIQAFANIYRSLGIEARAARNAEDLQRASRIILPGVGAFDWAMTRLRESGLRTALEDEVLGARKPVLGICVGMQMMAYGSEEGKLPGLGWIPGQVKRFDENIFQTKTHLPHMGWNSFDSKGHALFAGIANPEFYFLHSYFFDPESSESVLAGTDYGTRFASVVFRDHIYGVQFHPEKSHHWGVQLLRNFASL